MADNKPEATEFENPTSDVNDFIEEEPSTFYEVKWRTLLAIFALSLSNTCAALSNTVCDSYTPKSTLTDVFRLIPSYISKFKH